VALHGLLLTLEAAACPRATRPTPDQPPPNRALSPAHSRQKGFAFAKSRQSDASSPAARRALCPPAIRPLACASAAPPVLPRERDRLDVLLELTEGDLEKFGSPLGPRKKLHKAVAGLSAEAAAGCGGVVAGDRSGAGPRIVFLGSARNRAATACSLSMVNARMRRESTGCDSSGRWPTPPIRRSPLVSRGADLGDGTGRWPAGGRRKV
jgi:hypothetical protein